MPDPAVILVAAGPLADLGDVERRLAREHWPSAFVVAADGGYAHCLAMGLRPDLVVGDLDSLEPAAWSRLEAAGIPLLRLSRDKDRTDLQAALDEVVRRPPGRLIVLGALGGPRLDHGLSAVYAGIPLARQGWQIEYLGRREQIWLIAGPGGLQLDPRPGHYLSLIPLTEEASGVVIEGMRWELSGVSLRWGDSRGVSNEFSDRPAQIRLATGILAVVIGPAGAAECRPGSPGCSPRAWR
ncbi:MAG TPA: thiamine diphosphokinase [Clostridiales bacterium]|nr:thiamine diphosphokinase [Clostridiales bacterium]